MKGCCLGWNMIDWPFSAKALSRAANAKIKTRDKYFNNLGACLSRMVHALDYATTAGKPVAVSVVY